MVTLNALALLERKGKTKYWLYQQLGMSYQNFSKMVNNQTKSIRYENIEVLCQLLDCTPNELFTFTRAILFLSSRTSETPPQSGSGRKEQTKSKADKEAARTPLRSACSCSIEKPPMAGQGRSPCALWGFQRGHSLR